MISVVLVAGVGCGVIFEDHIKFDDRKITIVLAFFAISTWREASSSELASTSSVNSSATVANSLPSWKGKGLRWAASRSSASTRSESFMPLQCTKHPSGVEVIIRSLA
jgi:hypothetical protein